MTQSILRGATVPGTNDGSFAPHHKSEADATQVLAPFRPALTADDRERLLLGEWHGALADGYDEDTIERLAGEIESARLVCVWDYHDGYGFGGDSRIVCVGPDGTVYDIDLDMWAWLTEEDPDNPTTSLPDTVVGDRSSDVRPDDIGTDCGANWAYDEEVESDICRSCSNSLSDGEGYDGWCGTCADARSCQGCGEHIADELADIPDHHLCASCEAG